MEHPAQILRLDGDVSELATARDWLRSHLAAAGADPADAVLVAAELLTNAIEHGRSAPTVSLRLSADRVHLEVSDQSTAPPAIQHAPTVAGGYGLRIVDEVAAQWGWRRTAAGKVVWTELPRDPPSTGMPGVRS